MAWTVVIVLLLTCTPEEALFAFDVDLHDSGLWAVVDGTSFQAWKPCFSK